MFTLDSTIEIALVFLWILLYQQHSEAKIYRPFRCDVKLSVVNDNQVHWVKTAIDASSLSRPVLHFEKEFFGHWCNNIIPIHQQTTSSSIGEVNLGTRY